jgi:hypothetical protein
MTPLWEHPVPLAYTKTVFGQERNKNNRGASMKGGKTPCVNGLEEQYFSASQRLCAREYRAYFFRNR